MGGLIGLNLLGNRNSGFDMSALLDYYRSRVPAAPQQAAAARRPPPVSVQFAPWLQQSPLTTNVAKLNDAIAARSFVDLSDSAINRSGVDNDHKKLFAVFKGLTRLQALANRAAEDKVPDTERASLNKRFVGGIDEIRSFLQDKGFEDLTLGFGARVSQVDTTFRKPRVPTVYTGQTVVVGQSTDQISGLSGSEKFNVKIGRSSGDLSVAMDLAEISGPISVDSLVAYMNGKLEQAGALSRFSRVVQNGSNVNDPKRVSLSIQTVSTERLSFQAEETRPSIYVGAVAGADASRTASLTKLSDDASTVSQAYSRKISVIGGAVDLRGSAIDADGNVYIVGSTTENMDRGIVQGNSDVYLRKYDSAGQLVWQRLLGSSQEASGFAVATASDGSVAIAGRITDRLSGLAAGGNGDSFVAKFDATGKEIFARQIAPVTDDAANAVRFAADGSLIIAGRTSSAMSSLVTHAGDNDAYLMKLSSAGNLEWVRQFGGTGSDTASAVALTDDGHAIMTSLEGGQAVVRKLDLSNGTSDPVWSVNLGSVGQGSLRAVAVDGSAVYVAGSTTNTSLNAGGVAPILTAHGGGSDGFVSRINDSGTSGSLSYTTYVGGDGQDGVSGLAAANGAVYVSGATTSALNGGDAPSVSNAYVRKLDADGNVQWTHQFQGVAGQSSANTISVDTQGASVLDRLGLPRGPVAFDTSRLVTAGSSVRAGDHFFVRINDGSRRKITIEAGDTMRSLSLRINSALLLKGSASVSRAGGDGIKISATEGNVIELIAGSAGLDALAGLGLEPVKLDAKRQATSTAASTRRFSLGLESGMNLENKLKSKTITYQLGTALEVIKTAYMTVTGTSMRSLSELDQRALNSYQSASGVR